MRELDVPKKYQRLYEKARTGKSRKAALRMTCLQCVGWQEHEFRLCPSTHCQNYPYRGTGATDPASPPTSHRGQSTENRRNESR
mgnify:FL=1